MIRLGTLLGELHRRSVWQILGSYAVGAWIILQLAETLAGLIGLPLWFGPTVVVLILLGFPVLLVTSLVQGGRKRRAESGSGVGSEVSSGDMSTVRRLFTWRNAALAAIGGALFLGAGTAGYTGMRAAGIGPVGSLMAKGILETEERLILAEFEDRTSDGSLGETVTALFRIDLAQSPSVVLMEPIQLGPTLARMQRSSSEPLTTEVALELAQREGIKAVVTGEVLPLGSGAVISASLVTAASGETIVALKETARDISDVPDAVDRLSAQLRVRIGESLRTIQGDPPLEEVTTASLEALRKYAQAERANDLGDRSRAMALVEEALEVDSTFAMAWRKRGILYQNEGVEQDIEKARESFIRAYELRENLTDRERYLAEATYHTYLEEDPDRARQAYEAVLESYPHDRIALNNLAVSYGAEGDRERAAQLYLQAIRGGGAPAVTYTNAVFTLFELGQPDSARWALDRFGEAYPDNPNVISFEATLASAQFDFALAEEHTQRLLEEQAGNPMWEMTATATLASYSLLKGQLQEGFGTIVQVFDLQDRIGAELIPFARPLFEGTGSAQVFLSFLGDTVAARAALDEALAEVDVDTLPPAQVPWTDLANFYGEVGDPVKARAWLARWEEAVPQETREQGPSVAAHHGALAAIARTEGRLEEALEETLKAREASTGCKICFLTELGEAQARLGDHEGAVESFETYLETPAFHRLNLDNLTLHRALLGLAKSQDALGNSTEAVAAYRRLLDMWSDPDPELMPVIEEIRARVAELEAASPVATFSIVGFDPETGEMGVAVQSRVFSVGNGVIWGEAGVGIVATQAWVDVSYGPQGLELLRTGLSPQEVVDSILASDPDPLGERWPKEGRQFSVLDSRGNVATYTGPLASDWAGHRIGEYCSAQGNILAGPEVVDDMVRAFEGTDGHLSFRLLAALEAGQAAGGDRRGMQSAAMLIVKEDGGVWLNNDVVLRLQVDDAEEPIAELRRLVEIAARQREGMRRR